jgi:hypothetical protein
VAVDHHYFRAANTKAALRAMELPDGPLSSLEPGLDVVEAKGVDPYEALGQLIALIRRVPAWAPNLVPAIDISPEPGTKPGSAEEYEGLPEDSQWKTGPWLVELGGTVLNALATVDDARLADLAGHWAQSEEAARWVQSEEELNGTVKPDAALALVRDMIGLARRTRDARHRLYCWTSL